MPQLTFHGHATVSIHTPDSKLVIDPFFSENPHFLGSLDDIEADYILVTHGHYDHVADLIGLDTVLHIMHVLKEGLSSDKYSPANLLVEMVEEGKLGRKTGCGFYQY